LGAGHSKRNQRKGKHGKIEEAKTNLVHREKDKKNEQKMWRHKDRKGEMKFGSIR